MERIDLGYAGCNETNMRRAAVGVAGPEPEEHATVATESFQVRMARWPVLAVVIENMADPQRRQSLLIEGDRTTNVADRDEYMVEH